MSIAGIRSNRGDGYQTLVAFDWALKVLSDKDYQWLEIDSITCPVDDVVIGKVGDARIACQCKKNQIHFRAWTIADLADELDKAAHMLASDQNVQVRFYSRNNFGALAKLKEHSSTQHDENSYRQSLGKELQAVDGDLSAQLAKPAPNLSTFAFLCRTHFVATDDIDRMNEDLHQRLRQLVSNPEAAFNALWVKLDRLGGRMDSDNASVATQYRLTKGDLRTIIQQAGAMLAPPMDLAEIRRSFASTSAIGRSWRRDIAGQQISTSIVDELLAAIDAQKRSILLTGLPGSGKTCAMLTLQEALEERTKTRSDIVPLFIQSREFADLATSDERQAQGLAEQWVENTARLAEDARVIVVIDSLDVLSIARDHRVLQYFLAQTDRLLLIPNVTVVTACRDFDRHYDRRIAERRWDCEVTCQPLNWNSEIAPLLDTLGIATAAIDAITRELIRNPRELALFVELAQRDGSFNVVTSQALAQRYIDTIVRANNELGNTAIVALETIAAEMLQSRSLVIPYQRFTASEDIQRKLCSLNVLQETQDGKLTFGHQTLLDVLVISGAMRNGVTLNTFIHSLPPVPFVRPSIRSFVAQLAPGDRREFRKQLRTVLTGSSPFHIKRLVAESFAGQRPEDEDWSLIRDLRENHRAVFQTIYTSAGEIEWHRFWLKYLVPHLKMMRDAEGMAAHAHRITQWCNEDSTGVIAFWMEALSLEWLDSSGIARLLGSQLSAIKSQNLARVAPLVERLINVPNFESRFLGRVIAHCVTTGVVDDGLLWRYITDDLRDKNMQQISFGNRLRCLPHEFGSQNKQFLRQRMMQSSALLDLALESIEHWSNARAPRYGIPRADYREGFLKSTSYADTHSQKIISHKNSMNILLEAVEAAILQHAKTHSDWWQKNRERLGFHPEGALRYFAIRACTASPEANIELTGRMLRDNTLLASQLSYESGELIASAFRFLATPAQDAVMATILSMRTATSGFWLMKAQAELIIAIPCHLRSAEVQAVVDACEKKAGIVVRQPRIHEQSGVVSAPFSFEVFLDISDSWVLRLLAHYAGHSHMDGEDFLIGGEREVGRQLQEAASRHPARFLNFLFVHWTEIPNGFRDDIINGAASYLAYRYGNLRSHKDWQAVEEPDALLLANQILTELERHPTEWRHRRSTAKALEACANVIQSSQEAERLIFIATDFASLHEADPIEGDAIDLIDIGINMAKGNIADALMILADNFLEQGSEFPELLLPTLRRFASDEHPAVRAMILRRLPYLQSISFNLGWELFHLAMRDACGLWQIAERCLYNSYRNHFEIVGPLLTRLRNEGGGKDLKTWGHISALAAMTPHLKFTELLDHLHTLDNAEAWCGAANVWTNAKNIRQHQEQCLAGINSGLRSGGTHALEVARQTALIFDDNTDVIFVPVELISRCFSVFESHSSFGSEQHHLYGFHQWLNAMSQQDPEQALAAAEIYLACVSHGKSYIHNDDNSLTQLMTRLFAQADEREESDEGVMLQRVVGVQDGLLSLGVDGVEEWLKAAERP
ncbi:AAA family ATPase [Erwinia piriflorinigrans]|uniref:ATPase AAA-type core domain-containing protein n=1 Tax=Erwinia piriflorinigrans CFBP 5888 TaxID=1161919 RepID=V5Z9C4_9GAMM|nr:ATP-binding protein [Erwinia piriflorinigrans]CCG87548.1 hypothetical protein EPIR_2183 [Erwinia piriflorinigrans CFBP 5888]